MKIDHKKVYVKKTCYLNDIEGLDVNFKSELEACPLWDETKDGYELRWGTISDLMRLKSFKQHSENFELLLNFMKENDIDYISKDN